MTLIALVSAKVKCHLFSAYQIKDLERQHRSVSCSTHLDLQRANANNSHWLAHLNLRDIFKHLKMYLKFLLALILIWLKTKYIGKTC